jgi:hypothetical protein
LGYAIDLLAERRPAACGFRPVAMNRKNLKPRRNKTDHLRIYELTGSGGEQDFAAGESRIGIVTPVRDCSASWHVVNQCDYRFAAGDSIRPYAARS